MLPEWYAMSLHYNHQSLKKLAALSKNFIEEWTHQAFQENRSNAKHVCFMKVGKRGLYLLIKFYYIYVGLYYSRVHSSDLVIHLTVT
jgi:hypothetical protein